MPFSVSLIWSDPLELLNVEYQIGSGCFTACSVISVKKLSAIIARAAMRELLQALPWCCAVLLLCPAIQNGGLRGITLTGETDS